MAAERAGYIALRRGQGMRKWLSLMLMISCALFSLTGCGSAAPERTTVEVKKNGHVTHTIVEDFTESYYDLEGLKDTIEEACEAYNGAMGSELVTLEEAEVEDGVLTAVMDYRSASAYAGFNRQALFTGTVKEAYDAGYDLNQTLYSAQEDGGTIGKEGLLNLPKAHILVIREAIDVRVWDKVLYRSDDVILQEDGSLIVTDSGKLSFIVFK